MAQDGTIQIEVLMDTDEFQNELKKLGATAEAGFQTISAATEKMTAAVKKSLADMARNTQSSLAKMQASFKPLNAETQKAATGIEKFRTAVATIETAQKAVTIVNGLVNAWKGTTIALNAYSAATLQSNNVSVLLAQTLSASQVLVGLLTGKIALSTAAQLLWNAAVAAFPVMLILSAVALVIGAIVNFANSAKQESERIKESFDTIGQAASNFYSGIQQAESYLGLFNDTLFASSEEQQALSDNMQSVQNAITTICRTATAERRNLTASEITELQTYFEKLDALNQQQLNAEKLKSNAIMQQALAVAQNHNVSLAEYQANAQSWIKTAQEQAAEQERIIREQLTTELILKQEAYTTERGFDQKGYEEAVATTIAEKQAELDAVNDGLAQITAAYADGYAEMSGLQDVMQQKTGRYHQSIEDENKRHADHIDDINTNSLASQEDKLMLIKDENLEHSDRMRKIWSGLTASMSDEQKEQLGVFLTLAGQTELYGGQMSEKTETAAKNIVGSFDVLPKDLRKAMGNAMSPMLEEMEKYEPILYAKAQTIAEGVLKKLELGLEEKSPSKATRRIFRYLMLGAEIGMDDETGTLYKQTEDMAKGVVETAEDALGIASPSKVMRDEVGAMIMAGMAEGIQENSKETVDAFKKNLDNIQSLRDFDIINEDQYYERLEKLRDEYFAVGTKEWLDYTLKIYDYQKKAVEDQKKTIESMYNDIVKNATSKLAEVEKAQASFADKMKNYGSLYSEKKTVFKGMGENGENIEYTDIVLDLSQQRKELENYANLLEQVKAKENIPYDLFKLVRDMPIDKAVQYSEALLSASDADLEVYVRDWEAIQELSANTGGSVYAKEGQEAIDDSVQYMKDKLEEAGMEIPEGFFTSGSVAAENFGEAFITKIDNMMAELRDKVANFAATLTPVSVAMAGVPAGGAAVSSTSYTNTFNISPAKDRTVDQIAAWKAVTQVERMRGGY